MINDLLIRLECPADHGPIGDIARAAFEGHEEADLIQRLREDGDLRLSLVAAVDNVVVGHILFSDLPIIQADRMVDAVALAPVSVLPEYQHRGIGAQLCLEGIDLCRTLGVEAIVVLGHPSYYPKFGFSAERAAELDAPFSGEAFMALELKEGVLDQGGKVRYADAFGISQSGA